MGHAWMFLFYFLALLNDACGNKLKLIERRLHRIETKQDFESLSRREDFTAVSQRLEAVENQLNVSNENAYCCDTERNTNRDRSLEYAQDSDGVAQADFMTIIAAVRDEKLANSRMRRRVSGIENMMQIIETKVANVTSIRDEITSVKVNCENIAETMASFAKNKQEALDKIISSYMIKLSNKIDKALTDSWKPASCLEIHRNGKQHSGAYDIYPGNRDTPIRVSCDMETDGGGWTVFQRREDGSEDFFRNWLDYRFGFGNADGEFWLGNEYISILTSEPGTYELRIDMEDFDANKRFAKYANFQVLPNSENYKLIVGNFSGDAKDSLSYHSGEQFSTKDRDNDHSAANCAESYSGAWWYKSCHYSNLNGLYLRGAKTAHATGVNWYHWRGYPYRNRKVAAC